MTRKTIISTISLLLALGNGAVLAQSMTEMEVDRLFDSLSNWGRWGNDDQKGTVNLITPATRVAAAQLVQTGVSVSMAHEVLEEEAADNKSLASGVKGKPIADLFPETTIMFADIAG